MLTGQHPFQGQDPRSRQTPDLSKLPLHDQAVISRALHADPAQRWASATEMTLALEGTGVEPQVQQQLEQQHEDSFVKMLKKTRRVVGLPSVKNISGDIHRKITELVTGLGGKMEGVIGESPPQLNEDTQILLHRFQVCLPLGSARQHIEPFFAELGGKPVRQEPECYEMSLALPGSFWQKVRGKLPSVEVRIDLSRVHAMSATPVEVVATVSTQPGPSPGPADPRTKRPGHPRTPAQPCAGRLREAHARPPALAAIAADCAGQRGRQA